MNWVLGIIMLNFTVVMITCSYNYCVNMYIRSIHCMYIHKQYNYFTLLYFSNAYFNLYRYTFLLALEEKSTSDRNVWSLLVSVFRSLKQNPKAIQISGWSFAPFFGLFLFSDLLTTKDSSFKSVGAFTICSSTHLS